MAMKVTLKMTNKLLQIDNLILLSFTINIIFYI